MAAEAQTAADPWLKRRITRSAASIRPLIGPLIRPLASFHIRSLSDRWPRPRFLLPRLAMASGVRRVALRAQRSKRQGQAGDDISHGRPSVEAAASRYLGSGFFAGLAVRRSHCPTAPRPRVPKSSPMRDTAAVSTRAGAHRRWFRAIGTSAPSGEPSRYSRGRWTITGWARRYGISSRPLKAQHAPHPGSATPTVRSRTPLASPCTLVKVTGRYQADRKGRSYRRSGQPQRIAHWSAARSARCRSRYPQTCNRDRRPALLCERTHQSTGPRTGSMNRAIAEVADNALVAERSEVRRCGRDTPWCIQHIAGREAFFQRAARVIDVDQTVPCA